jgi:uncharacterized membrane protein YdjX (TVP38/TMEM64 family)
MIHPEQDSAYVVGSFIGMLPGTVLYVYLGSLVTSISALGNEGSRAGTAQQVLYWPVLARRS